VPGRAALVERIAALVGDDVLRVADAGTGWPASGELVIDGDPVPVDLYVGPVGLSHRGRDEVERRFQNPGSGRPITRRPRRTPLLLGLWDDDPRVPVGQPVVVAADPWHRIGRTTRFSVFVALPTLVAALERGWAQEQNSAGETIRCFAPPLLPLSQQAGEDPVGPDAREMQIAVQGSGLLDADPVELPAAAERARRVGSALVRDSRFSLATVEAYGGRCAMCGLGAGVVQGAHIYPVSAPGSRDEPWNGLALCANHHLAFDRHLIAVDPRTFEIIIHPYVLDEAAASSPEAAFVDGTYRWLTGPHPRAAQPDPEMFEMRYWFFAGSYDWLPPR
jgi:hypothetical protein